MSEQVTSQKVVIEIEVDVDTRDYVTNYGNEYDPDEATEYVVALVEDALSTRFTQVGGWASLVGEVRAR